MESEKVLDLLMDIQEKVGRIDERLKKVESTDRKAEEAIRLGQKNEEKISDLTATVNELREERKWNQRTAIGAIISAVVAVISWLHPPF